MINIGVFCSSLDGKKEFSECAHELGIKIAESNLSLVYGGGKLGLMGIIAKAVKDNGSKVISIIPNSVSYTHLTLPTTPYV